MARAGVKLVGALRSFVGVTLWTAPSVFVPLYGLVPPEAAAGRAKNESFTVVTRLFAIRDLVLGAGLLYHLANGNQAFSLALVQVGLLCDLADVLSTAVALGAVQQGHLIWGVVAPASGLIPHGALSGSSVGVGAAFFAALEVAYLRSI